MRILALLTATWGLTRHCKGQASLKHSTQISGVLLVHPVTGLLLGEGLGAKLNNQRSRKATEHSTSPALLLAKSTLRPTWYAESGMIVMQKKACIRLWDASVRMRERFLVGGSRPLNTWYCSSAAGGLITWSHYRNVSQMGEA